VRELDQKGVGLRVLNLGGETVDTKSATGRLILNIFSGFAQFEREMMLERQREGVARAKAAGKYKGRKPIAPEQRAEVVRLAGLGLTKAAIARKLGLGEASVYRILAQAKKGKT
ncbi:MAG: recombinase family protein, partial [Thermoflexales bacterium]